MHYVIIEHIFHLHLQYHPILISPLDYMVFNELYIAANNHSFFFFYPLNVNHISAAPALITTVLQARCIH